MGFNSAFKGLSGSLDVEAVSWVHSKKKLIFNLNYKRGPTNKDNSNAKVGTSHHVNLYFDAYITWGRSRQDSSRGSKINILNGKKLFRCSQRILN